MSAVKKIATPTGIQGTKAELGQRALKEKRLLKQLVSALSGPDRSLRSLAAGALHEVACASPQLLLPHGAALIDALDRPEVHTRWETLGVLETLATVDTRLVEKAVPAAIECLHDTESIVVRIAAYRLLAAWGSTTEVRAARIWPLLSDAARIYHGDSEYGAMLGGVVTLLEGAAGDDIKWAAAELFHSDLTNPDRSVSRRAKRIAQLKPKRKPAKKKAPAKKPAAK